MAIWSTTVVNLADAKDVESEYRVENSISESFLDGTFTSLRSLKNRCKNCSSGLHKNRNDLMPCLADCVALGRWTETKNLLTHMLNDPVYLPRKAFLESLNEEVDYLSRPQANRNSYLNQVTKDGIVRWDRSCFPLKVFVQDVTGSEVLTQEDMVEALRDWTVGPIIGLMHLSPSISEANVICTLACDESLPNSIPVQANTVLTHTFGRLSLARISIAIRDPKLLSRELLKRIFQHELGHALGLNGHSWSKQDVLYPFVQYSTSRGVTLRDRKTLLALYAVVP